MQAELNLAWWRAHAADQTKAGVVDVVIGVAVAGYVKDVEEIGAEAEDVILLPDVEVLEQRHIDLAIAGSTLAAVVRGAELEIAFVAVGAHSVIDSCLSTGRCRRIGTKPVGQRSIPNDQLAILIRSVEAIDTVCTIVILAKYCDRETRIEYGSGRQPPSSEYRIHRALGISAISAASAEGKVVYADEVHAVADVHRRRSPVRNLVVSVLERRSVPALVRLRAHLIVSRRICQRLSPSVVERIFEAVTSSLPHGQLARTVIHSGFGLGD